MNKTILVVAAHADDECLGCGGTVSRHVTEGDVVHAVFMADGTSARPGDQSEATQRRMEAAKTAHSVMRLKSAEFLNFPDNRMDSLSLLEIIQPLESLIQKLRPQIIYTHHSGDLNIDHRITHQAVLTACRPLPDHSVLEIYSFEVLSSTEWAVPQRESFLPNVFIDITGHLSTKTKALEAYGLEMRMVPHTRSIEHSIILAKHRGYTVGLHAAEAFMAVRLIR